MPLAERLIAIVPLRWRSLAMEFLRFGVAGVLGLGVDIVVVYSLRGSIGIYAAGLAAYLVATSVTWAINRVWAFAGRGSGRKRWQWLRFLAANSLGFVLNRGAFFALVSFSPPCAHHPVLAIAAGSVAGMGANFTLSRMLVFKKIIGAAEIVEAAV